MNKTTDIRSITCPDIALDPVKDGPRLLARVKSIFPDGQMLLQFVGRSGKGYYKNGVLESPSSCGAINLGSHVITWQGELPADVDAGHARVAQDIEGGNSRIIDMDEVKVPVRRRALAALVDSVMQHSGLDPQTQLLLDEVRRAAA